TSSLFANQTPENRDKYISDYVDKFIGNVYYKKAREEGVSVEKLINLLDLEFRNNELNDNKDANTFYQTPINELIEKYKDQIDGLQKQNYNDILNDESLSRRGNMQRKELNKFIYNRVNLFKKILHDSGLKVNQVNALTTDSKYLYVSDENNEYKIRISDHESANFNNQKEMAKLFSDNDLFLNLPIQDTIEKNLQDIKDFFKNNNKDIYYQNINTNLNQNQEIKPLDLTKEFADIKATNKEEVAKEIERRLNELLDKELETNTAPLKIKITEQNKGHVIRSNVVLNTGQQKRHNTALTSIENIINNSVLTGEAETDLSHNTRKQTIDHKKEVEKYRYFTTPIRINDNDYNVILTTELLKQAEDKNVSNLYNLRVKKNLPSNVTGDAPLRANAPLSEVNTTIPQNFQNVKSNQGTPKGSITFTNDSKAIINLFENTSDPSTLIHELGHYYRRFTQLLADNGSKIAQKELQEIRKMTGNRGGEFTEKQEEIFARQFEAYVLNGETTSQEAKNIFQKFSEWLKEIYESIKALNVPFDDNVKKFFDNFLFGTEEQQQPTEQNRKKDIPRGENTNNPDTTTNKTNPSNQNTKIIKYEDFSDLLKLKDNKMLFQMINKAKTHMELNLYEQLYKIEKEPLDLTAEFADIADYDTDTKIKLINERLQSLIGYDIITEDDEVVDVRGKDIPHIKGKVKIQSNKILKDTTTTAIDNLQSIIERSNLIETKKVDSTHNTGKKTIDKKKEWSKVNIFNSIIKINGEDINVIITTYQDKKDGVSEHKNSLITPSSNDNIPSPTNKSNNHIYEIYTKPATKEDITLFQTSTPLQKRLDERKKELQKEYTDDSMIEERLAIEFAEAELKELEKEIEREEDIKITEEVDYYFENNDNLKKEAQRLYDSGYTPDEIEKMLYEPIKAEFYKNYYNNLDKIKQTKLKNDLSQKEQKKQVIEKTIQEAEATIKRRLKLSKQELFAETKRIAEERANKFKAEQEAINNQLESETIDPDRVDEIKNETTKNLFAFIDKLYAKQKAEKTQYEMTIFKKKQAEYKQVSKLLQNELGKTPFDLWKIKEPRNIDDLLANFERINGGNTQNNIYKNSQKMDKKGNEDHIGDYFDSIQLTYDEYNKIVNFEKQYLKEHIRELNDTLNKTKESLEKTQQRVGGIADIIEKQQAELEKLKEIKDFQKEIETAIKEDKDLAKKGRWFYKFDLFYRDRISKAIKENVTPDALRQVINKSLDEQLRLNYDEQLTKIINKTIFTDKKGNTYGKVAYEDSKSFDELRNIMNEPRKYINERRFDELKGKTNLTDDELLQKELLSYKLN
ncbi:MAG: hypothetical protein LBF23_01780, partial [Endomicrobium sp.]|nr:hypothetical protein [Endomicrobium sp.]